jgi:hypothetical protein
MDPEIKKLLEQLLLDIDICLHGKGSTGATLRLMQFRIKGALETPEEREARIAKKQEFAERHGIKRSGES